SSAAGLSSKRGDRITVSAVEFVKNTQLEPVPPMGLAEHAMRHLSSVVFAVTFLVFTALMLWFGVRPALRMILEAAPAKTEAERALAAEGAAGNGGVKALGTERQPNLIADLTSKMGRAPQKRLEQMVDYDEEQATTILKQWVRGARA